MLKKIEMLSAPRTNVRSHQMPLGSCLPSASSSNPAGKARSMATVIGEKSGRNAVVTI